MTVKYHYGSFPPKIAQQDLLPVLSAARTQLGRYDGLLSVIQNSDVLITPLLQQEAVLSSRIEGTQSSLSDVLEYEANEKNKKFSDRDRADIHEILNYYNSIKAAVEMLKKRPLSLGVVRDTHEILMRGVRGAKKDPGEFRRIPNWIGPDGCKEENATFVPIGADKLPDALSLWEKYIHADDDVDDLVKAAVLHAEFEALHPFLDGNGRLGRILIPLFLWQKGLLQKPHFYMSAYFEKNHKRYYNALLEVSKSGAWDAWCHFFIAGVVEEAENNYTRAMRIHNLYNDLKAKVPAMTKSQYGIIALDYIFAKPYFSTTQFVTEVDIPKSSAHRLLKVFDDQRVLLKAPRRGSSPALHIFLDLVDIAQA